MIVGPKFPLYRPAPRWLLLGLLAAEGFLMLSERFEWFAFGKHKGWPVLICLGAVGGVLSLGLLCLPCLRPVPPPVPVHDPLDVGADLCNRRGL